MSKKKRLKFKRITKIEIKDTHKKDEIITSMTIRDSLREFTIYFFQKSQVKGKKCKVKKSTMENKEITTTYIFMNKK